MRYENARALAKRRVQAHLRRSEAGQIAGPARAVVLRLALRDLGLYRRRAM